MMFAKPSKDFFCRNVRPRIGQPFFYLLPQPINDGRFLAIERTNCGA